LNPVVQRTYKHDKIMEDLNITEEMLNSNSVMRQLNDKKVTISNLLKSIIHRGSSQKLQVGMFL